MQFHSFFQENKNEIYHSYWPSTQIKTSKTVNFILFSFHIYFICQKKGIL